MERLTLVGENPGGGLTLRPFDPAHPVRSLSLTGRAGQTLCDLAGWDWVEYLRSTDRRNLFYDPQPRWDGRAAQMSALRMIPELVGSAGVVLLGRKVATAFGFEDEPLYTWFVPGVVTPVACIPHPSGLNRMWNDPAERARARLFLAPLLAMDREVWSSIVDACLLPSTTGRGEPRTPTTGSARRSSALSAGSATGGRIEPPSTSAERPGSASTPPRFPTHFWDTPSSTRLSGSSAPTDRVSPSTATRSTRTSCR